VKGGGFNSYYSVRGKKKGERKRKKRREKGSLALVYFGKEEKGRKRLSLLVQRHPVKEKKEKGEENPTRGRGGHPIFARGGDLDFNFLMGKKRGRKGNQKGERWFGKGKAHSECKGKKGEGRGKKNRGKAAGLIRKEGVAELFKGKKKSSAGGGETMFFREKEGELVLFRSKKKKIGAEPLVI